MRILFFDQSEFLFLTSLTGGQITRLKYSEIKAIGIVSLERKLGGD